MGIFSIWFNLGKMSRICMMLWMWNVELFCFLRGFEIKGLKVKSIKMVAKLLFHEICCYTMIIIRERVHNNNIIFKWKYIEKWWCRQLALTASVSRSRKVGTICMEKFVTDLENFHITLQTCIYSHSRIINAPLFDEKHMKT